MVTHYSRLLPIIAGFLILCSIMSPGARAQPKADFVFTLDTTPIIHQMQDPITKVDTVYGTIQNLAGDSAYFTFQKTNANLWIVSVFIGGKNVRGFPKADTIGLAPNETLPVVSYVRLYEWNPDTSSVCFTVASLRDSIAEQHCIPLYVPGVIPPLEFAFGGSVRYQLGQPISSDTVRGYINNRRGDSIYFWFKGTPVSQWIVDVKIGKKDIPGWQEGALVGIGPREKLAVEAIMQPYAEFPDTQRVTLTVTPLPEDTNTTAWRYMWLAIDAPSDVWQETSPPHQARIYPNPASISITICLTPDQAARNPIVRIFNEAGKEVTRNFHIIVSANNILIERGDVSSGTYFYQLLNEHASSDSTIDAGKFVIR